MARTYAFLQTDLQGSSAAWDTHPDAALQDVLLLFRRCDHLFAEAGGRVYKKRGDGQAAAFETCDQALKGVQAMVTDPELQPLLCCVRCVLHMGEATDYGDEFLGACLNTVGRMLDLGHAGQILASHEFLSGCSESPRHLELETRTLRGILAPTRLFQLNLGPEDVAFPPLRGAQPRSNLGRRPEGFVGRERELADLRTLVLDRKLPLVSIVGFGGMGKSTLALEFGHQSRAEFEDRVWWVRADQAYSEAHLLEQVCQALRFEGTEQDLLTQLPQLVTKSSLLIFDCFEASVAYAPALERLLAVNPQIQIIVTSRQRLEVASEQVLELLGIVDVFGRRPRWEPGFDLFLAAASHSQPGYTTRAADRPVLREIIRRAEAIPLAIQLCAGRVNHMSLPQMRDQLASNVLATLQRGATPGDRHGSMRAVISASFDLLEEQERTLLGLLASFRHGFDSDIAAAICGQDDFFTPFGLLVNGSLVSRQAESGGTRFRLMDSVVEFVRDIVGFRPPADFRARYCEHYVRWMIEQASAPGPDSPKLAFEVSNFMQALPWLGTDALDERLAYDVPRFLHDRGFLYEFDVMADWLRARAHPVPLRAKLLALIAIRQRSARNWDAMQSALQERYRLLRDGAVSEEVVDALGELLVGECDRENPDQSDLREYLSEFRAVRTSLGTVPLAESLDWDAAELLALDRLGDAESSTLGESLWRSLIDSNMVRARFAHRALAEFSLNRGDHEVAIPLFSLLARHDQPHAQSLGIFGLGRAGVALKLCDVVTDCLTLLEAFERANAPRAMAYATELRSAAEEANLNLNSNTSDPSVEDVITKLPTCDPDHRFPKGPDVR